MQEIKIFKCSTQNYYMLDNCTENQFIALEKIEGAIKNRQSKTLATVGTQQSHSTTTNKAKNKKKQKAAKMSNTDPTKKTGMNPCVHEG